MVGSRAGCCQTPFHLLAFPCSACAGCTFCAIWWDSDLLISWLWSAASGEATSARVQPLCSPPALPTLPVPSFACQFPPIPFCKVQTLSGYRLAAPTGSWGDPHSHYIQFLPSQYTHISVAVAGDRPQGAHVSPLGGSGEPQSSRGTLQAGPVPAPQSLPQLCTLWGLRDTQTSPLTATDWFLYAEPTLYSWNKFHLIMRSLNSFYMLLDLVC